jgi:hypothetical protein
MKVETDLPFCVRNVTTSQHALFKFRYNIFIGVRIIKEMPGSVAIGTTCIFNNSFFFQMELFALHQDGPREWIIC